MVSAFFQRLTQHDAVLVSVHASRGSVPREVGAWMAVFADVALGTIGGEAAGGGGSHLVRYALGPNLGQCCGGTVTLRFERVTARDVPYLAARLDSPRMPVALFGGGHVGHALVQVLAPLPMDVWWLDSRDGVFPVQCPASVQCEHSDPVQSAVPGLSVGTRVVIIGIA